MRRSAAAASGIHGPLRAVCSLGLMVATGACLGLAMASFSMHLGISPVLTGSMRPTFGPGALLVTRSIPIQAVRSGMIVVFTPPREHVEFAHRVTSVSGPPSDPVITTKGDANPAADPWNSQLTAATVPQVVASVPWIGRLMVGVRGPIQALMVIFGGVVVAVAGSRWILHPRRSTLTA